LLMFTKQLLKRKRASKIAQLSIQKKEDIKNHPQLLTLK